MRKLNIILIPSLSNFFSSHPGVFQHLSTTRSHVPKVRWIAFCCCCCWWGFRSDERIARTSYREEWRMENNWFFLPDRLDTKVLINFLRTRIFRLFVSLTCESLLVECEECEKYISIRHFHLCLSSSSFHWPVHLTCPPIVSHVWHSTVRKTVHSNCHMQQIDCVVWITTMFIAARWRRLGYANYDRIDIWTLRTWTTTEITLGNWLFVENCEMFFMFTLCSISNIWNIYLYEGEKLNFFFVSFILSS